MPDIDVIRREVSERCLVQLHSELVRATIMKDFVDFFGVSK